MRNFLQKLVSVFTQKDFNVAGTQFLNGFEDATDAANLTSYKDSLYLYIAVSMISKRVAGINLDLYKIKDSKGHVEEVYQHELIDLINRPNLRQTKRQFWEYSVAHYLLAGESFWYLEKNEAGTKTLGIQALRPDFMEIKLEQNTNNVVAYEYGEFGNKITIRPEDILHIQNIDPTNHLRGVGVVRPASQRITTEKEASQYQANFFKNQGRPDVAVFLDREITAEQTEEARQGWKRIYGGNKGGQAGFFGSDVKKLETLNNTPKEMDFIGSQNFLRDDILAALHIPKAMVTSDNVNLANAQTAMVMYLTEAVIPVFEAFLDVINNKMLEKDVEGLFFDYVSPVPEDRDAKIKEAKELVGTVLTQNEARTLLGYDSMDGADALKDPNAMPAVNIQAAEKRAKAIMKSRPALLHKFKGVEAVVESLMESQKNDMKRSMNSIFETKAAKASYAKAFNDKVDKKAKSFKEKVDEFNDQLLKNILEKNKDGFTVDNFMEAEKELGDALKLFTPYMKDRYAAHGQNTLDTLFNPKKDVIGQAEQFFITEAMFANIENRAAFFTGSMLNTTYNELQLSIIDGLSNGDSVDVIGRTLRDKIDDISVARGKTIARTETSWLLSNASNDAYEQSSVVVGKEWITAGDANVRSEHQDNYGAIVATGGVFPNGESYPGERTINCRCVLAPAV